MFYAVKVLMKAVVYCICDQTQYIFYMTVKPKERQSYVVVTGVPSTQIQVPSCTLSVIPNHKWLVAKLKKNSCCGAKKVVEDTSLTTACPALPGLKGGIHLIPWHHCPGVAVCLL